MSDSPSLDYSTFSIRRGDDEKIIYKCKIMGCKVKSLHRHLVFHPKVKCFNCICNGGPRTPFCS